MSNVHGSSRSPADDLAGVIWQTPWVDTHEHLVEESCRLQEAGYGFVGPLGNDYFLAPDFSVLFADYSIRDLVSAGLPAPDAADFLRSPLAEPPAKWAAIAPFVEATRATGYLRALDLSTERLFGARLTAATCEAIDAAARALRRPGFYRHVLQNVANVESCQVHSLDHDPFCATSSVENYLFARCLDLAAQYDLPVKLHLGYVDGNGIKALPGVFRHVEEAAGLLHDFPRVTFVLMHIGWPHQEELLAVVKHYPNAVVDLCWAWILAPMATRSFVTSFLTTAPMTKLLCFGGDYVAIENVVGHAELARRGLHGALRDLVESGWCTTDEASAFVEPLMRGNALRIFGAPAHAGGAPSALRP